MSSNTYLIEHDSLGPLQVPANAFYGIYSLHACENFPDQTAFHLKPFTAMGTVINSEINNEFELHRMFNGFIMYDWLWDK